MFALNELSPEAKKRLIEARKDPLLFAETFLLSPNPGPPFGPFKASYIQRQILQTQARDLWVCVNRRAGNCLAANSYVIDYKTKRPIRIEEAKASSQTLCYDFKKNKTEFAACEWVESGIKPCVKLKFDSGNSLTPSTDHLVFDSKKGWIRTDQVTVGSKLLVASEIPHGTETATEQQLLDLVQSTIDNFFVPNEVFLLNEESLKLYLKALFAYYGKVERRGEGVIYTIFYKTIAFDVQHLLSRFEIFSRVTKDGAIRIDEEIDKNIFLNRILDLDIPILELPNPRRWNIVVDVEYVGARKTYDMCVGHPDTAYIANQIVVHNSFSFAILALWHAITQEGKKIVVFTQSTTQRDEFFRTIDEWISANPLLQEMQSPVGNTKDPQIRTFVTGSYIAGYILGMASGGEGKLRGITADIVFVDEAQGLADEDWKVVLPIMRGDLSRRDRIKCYIAGTLNKANGYYYEKVDKIGTRGRDKVLKINIEQNLDWTDEMREEERASVSERVWKTEYMLEVAEEDASVFKETDLDLTFSEDWEPTSAYVHPNNPLFLTVDWDKVQCGTNILVTQYDPVHKSVRWIHHEEIPRGQWTYTEAVRRIIQLYEIYRPALVVVDQGASEKQWEDLQLAALQNPGLGLAERLVRLAFNSKIKVPNLMTGEDELKMVKPYLVEMLRGKMQQGLVKIPKHLEQVRFQFSQYKVEERTERTVKYSSKDEHIIDCFSFVMFAIYTLFENPYERRQWELNNTNVIRVPRQDELVRNLMDNASPEELESMRGALSMYHRTSIGGRSTRGLI
jgi:replicative DNA helicase